MMSLTRALLCLAVLTTLGSAGTRPRADQSAAAYRPLVDDFRHQDATSLSRAAALGEAELRSFVDAASNGTDGVPPWSAQDLRAAAMLHTYACLRLLTSGNSGAAFAHVNAAARLIDASTTRDNASRAFAALWYTNASAMLARLNAPVWARTFSERSRSVVPPSPADELLRKGIQFEISACQFVSIDGFGMKLSVPLKAAVTAFEQALRLDPSLHRAALHLGRSRILQGAPDDARPWLEVATHSPLAADRYLALLFLGSIAEQEGRLDEAESRYRAATSTFTWGQSGPLALARLLSRTKREAESRAVVGEMVERRGRTVDPLWTYLARPAEEPGGILDLLRAEISQ